MKAKEVRATSSNQPYYWYLKHTDTTNQAYGYSGGVGTGVSAPYNVYYWQVLNNGATPQAWQVCYS